jgi:hypothetical protein
MSAFQRLTEADLRAAMRDRRYWLAGHPERAAYGAWVGEGWRALYPDGGQARMSVWVRPYIREGHPVTGHWRGAPPGGGGITPVGARPPRDRAGRQCHPARGSYRSKAGSGADMEAAVAAQRCSPGGRPQGSHHLRPRPRRRGRASSPSVAGRYSANTSTAPTSACRQIGIRQMVRASSKRCGPMWIIRTPFASSAPIAGNLWFTIWTRILA